MAGRRRVRLLAVVLVFVVVATLYTRRAPIDAYRDFVTEQVVGGGAVLRGDRKPEVQQPAALPTTQPAAVPSTTSPFTPVSQRPQVSSTRAAEATRLTESTSVSSLVPASTLAEPSFDLHYHLPPITEDDELPYEIGEGRVEIEATSAASAIHWTKQPEHFPITTTSQFPTSSSKPMRRIQYAGKGAGKADIERLAIIKEATQHAWNGYRDNAFGADELEPISGGRSNPFNGWGATLVDSLDTLWIMGMKEEFEEAVEAVRKIDFTTSLRPDIPLFETTIRYLGGLVAAYDISGKQAKYSILLDKAVELAEILYSAFDTPNRMPQTFYRWKPAFASQPHRAGHKVVLAEIGSLNLEFTRLAQLTGEPKYYDAIARITDAFDEWQSNTRLPGMWPTVLDASGCQKPAQVASSPSSPHGQQQPVPGGDGQMMQANEPVQHGTGSSVRKQQIAAQAELELDKKMRRPGTGKIIGHGDPIPEGALDGKSKEMLLNELGSSKAKRQLEHLTPESLTEKERDELVSKSKLNTTTTHKQELRRVQEDDLWTGQDVCISQGLASSSKNGYEYFGLGGQADSVYEYLPKEYMLLGGLVDQYRTMYEYSVETAIENLIFRPMNVDGRDIQIAGKLKVSVNTTDGSLTKKLLPEAEHLTCFAGGMFALGGKLFDRPGDVEIGRKLTDGCLWAYNSTTTGIMPEIFTAVKCESLEECKWNQTAYWQLLDPYADTRTRRPKVVSSLPPKTTMAAPAANPAETSTLAVAAITTQRVVNAGPPAPDPDEIYPARVRDRRQLPEAATEPSTTPSRPTPSDRTNPTPPNEYNAPLPPKPAPAHPVYTPKPPLSHSDFVQKKIVDDRLPPGFVKIASAKYILRPEAIESVFYLYRITGDPYYREAGWAMFTAIDEHTRALYGHAAIDDVTKMAPELKDTMESFWVAETLKYFWLLFDEPQTWSLDEWVLNTEAHFFRRPKFGFKD